VITRSQRHLTHRGGVDPRASLAHIRFRVRESSFGARSKAVDFGRWAAAELRIAPRPSSKAHL
jgi:hypothetical protein